MTKEALTELARSVGLNETWTDAAGEPQVVRDDVLRRVLAAMGLPSDTPARLSESRRAVKERHQRAHAGFLTAEAGTPTELPPDAFRAGTARLVLESGEERDVELESRRGRLLLPGVDTPGYHRLELDHSATTVAVAPRRAFGISDTAPGRKLWGMAVQIYGLPGGGGAGDFAALAEFAEAGARRGATALAISPVHALFTADPSRYSPYAPSSRDFLNVLYAAPAAALGSEFVRAAAGDRSGSEGDDARLVDWAEVSRRRLDLFAKLYDAYLVGAPDRIKSDFQGYRRDGGQALEQHALFDALHFEFRSRGMRGDWQSWPAEYRDPASTVVSSFAAEHRRDVEFHQFLQWLADRSLADAQARAKRAGMDLGLISDLAIGLHSGGSHAWSRRDELLVGLSVGAPPDPINAQGQNWGLTAISPETLAMTGFAPFLATLRAALRHAGGIRIDHVLGLNRLWLIPDGASPTEGAYLRYPFRDLMRLLVLESHRHRAILIGEDLGTVPEGFHERLSDAGLMGMDVLWFARDRKGGFVPPEQWAPDRVGLTTTHDLPTVAGWWRGHDIDWAERCRILSGPEQVAAARSARRSDRRKLWSACRRAGTAGGRQPRVADPKPVVDAAVGFVARSASDLAIIALEDVLGLEEQPNIPGTVDEHPNWRRRLPDKDSEALLARPAAAARLEILRRERSVP